MPWAIGSQQPQPHQRQCAGDQRRVAQRLLGQAIEQHTGDAT
jgi:hypothetical protein